MMLPSSLRGEEEAPLINHFSRHWNCVCVLWASCHLTNPRYYHRKGMNLHFCGCLNRLLTAILRLDGCDNYKAMIIIFQRTLHTIKICLKSSHFCWERERNFVCHSFAQIITSKRKRKKSIELSFLSQSKSFSTYFHKFHPSVFVVVGGLQA